MRHSGTFSLCNPMGKNSYRRTYMRFAKNRKKTQKYGCVYIVTHPLFEGWVKMGSASNIRRRLTGYNVYDPLQRFRLYASITSLDCSESESLVLETFRAFGYKMRGEWVRCSPEVAKVFLEEIDSVLKSLESKDMTYEQRSDVIRVHISGQMNQSVPTFNKTSVQEKTKRASVRLRKQVENRTRAANLWTELMSGSPVQIN